MRIAIENLTPSQQEDLKRFRETGERLLRRAQADPAVARQLMREIGYYKIMGIPDPDKVKSSKPKAKTGITSSRKPAARKAIPTKRKRTESKA